MMRQTTHFKLTGLALLTASILAFSGCKTISEDACLAGNWEAIGFKDGSRGHSPDRLSKIAKTCGKCCADVDNTAYLTGFEAGLPNYCTFDNGFERGKNGNSYNQVCSGPLAADFAPGFEEGRVVYEIYREHNQLIKRYQDREQRLYQVRKRLEEDELTDKERDKLKHRARRLKRELENLRVDIRLFERLNYLPRSRF